MNGIVERILTNYKNETPGVQKNLVHLLNQGRTSGSGKVVIYAVDQGFEHGPLKSFAKNPLAHDPLYHFKFASNAGLSAFAAPLGLLEMGAGTYAGRLPLILKMNSSNALSDPEEPLQALTASVDDALRLGCIGVGFTIYPGSNALFHMLEDLKDVVAEARAKGLLVIVWSYPRGHVSAAGETAVDIVAYGAHMACLMGAHIVKVKVPTPHLETLEAKEAVQKKQINLATSQDCISYVVRSCFEGQRLVIFSGGTAKTTEALLEETRTIQEAGGAGSIIGRNIFQRPYEEALHLTQHICDIYTQQS